MYPLASYEPVDALLLLFDQSVVKTPALNHEQKAKKQKQRNRKGGMRQLETSRILPNEWNATGGDEVAARGGERKSIMLARCEGRLQDRLHYPRWDSSH